MSRMRWVWTGLLATLVAAGVAGSGRAAERVAVIDFERAMKEFHKTKPAEEEVERLKTDFKAEMDRMVKKLEKLQEEFEAAREETRNKALSEEAVKAKLADAEKRLMDVKEQEADMRKFSDRERRRLMDATMRIRKRLSDEIQEVVRKYASEKGLSMVLDSSSAVPELRGAVVYREEALDITAAVLKVLNEGKAAAKPDAKP